MGRDFSFLKLVSNFDDAKRGDNPNVATLCYQGLISMLPNETFCQKTNVKDGISFVGGIKVELIDNCQNVVQDITDNFFYYDYESANGTKQIDFEFGMIGIDFKTKPLFLKITDLVNQNIYYSYSFLITNYYKDLSTRIEYTNRNNIYGIDYATSPRTQTIRLVKVYDHTPVNERSLKEYTSGNGNRNNYRNITTFLRKYLCDGIDYFINDRLEVVLSHDTIYINGELATISDFKTDERIGNTNIMKSEFIVNKKGILSTLGFQIYEGLEVISLTPEHLSSVSVVNDVKIEFNKNVTINPSAEFSLYKDNIFVANYPIFILGDENIVYMDYDTYLFEEGVYNVVVPNNATIDFDGITFGNWTFTVASAEYNDTEYNNEFLI